MRTLPRTVAAVALSLLFVSSAAAVCNVDPTGSVTFEPAAVDGWAGVVISGHQNADWVRIIYRGSTNNYDLVAGQPLRIGLDARCLAAAAPVEVILGNCAGVESGSRTLTVPGSIAALDHTPVVQASAIPFDSSGSTPQSLVRVRAKWTVPYVGGNTTLEATFQSARGGSRIMAPLQAVPHEGEASWPFQENGTLVVKVTSCSGTGATRTTTKNVPILLGCRTCSEGCAPACVADPIQTTTGNMTFTDVDPLPGSPFLPFRRTYDSGNNPNDGALFGLFGRGWTTLFDARLSISGSLVAVSTESGAEYLFEGGQQVAPPSGNAPTILSSGGTSWTHTDADGQFVRTFTDGRISSYRDVRSGRSVAIERNGAGDPMRVADSWGAWAWVVTVGPGAAGLKQITRIEPEGRPDLAWTYAYSGNDLVLVTSPAGQWRRYTYTLAGRPVLSAIRDPQDRLIESHTYNGMQATNSTGPSGDLQSIVYAQPGRVADEWKTVYAWASGKVETHYVRPVGTELRTVEISGGCPSCSSSGDGVFVYDPQTGNPLRSQDARGYITESTYFANGRLQSRKTHLRPPDCDPATQSCRLTPNALKDAPAFIETSASVTSTYTYDALWTNRPATITTESVRTTPGSRVESFTYHPITGDVVQHRVTGWTGLNPVRSETRTTTSAYYNGSEGAAFAPGGAFQAAWLSLAQPVAMRKSVDGPRTDVIDVTRYVYYPIHASVPGTLRGQLAATQNALGHITRYEAYDLFGNVTRVVDPNGIATEMVYDSLGRLVSSALKAVPGCNTTADPLCATDLVTTRSYFGAGPLASETRPEGGVTKYEYDGEARISAITRGPSASDQRERIETDYDPATKRKSAVRIYGYANGTWGQPKKSETYAYDSDSQLTSLTHADGAIVAYTYDLGGQVRTIRDENHATPNTVYHYDAGGRLTRVVQTLAAATIATSYSYDRNGNLTSVTDPNGNVTSYTYDDFGQLLQQDSVVTGTTKYSYNLGGLLISTEDANGSVTNRYYDALGRLFHADAMRNNVHETVSWGYDSWAGLGRLASMSDPSGFTAWYYTRAGQMHAEQRNIDGTLYTTQQYRFDRNGNPTVVTYPSGRSFTYAYDYADRPISITTPGATIVSSAQYLPFGPLRELVYGNGSVRTTTYDNRYRIDLHSWVNGATTLASYDYAHDPAGNVTQMSDLVTAGFNRQFGYDDLHRLTATSTGSQLWGTRPYTYDAMGNIKSTATGIPFTYQGTTPKLASVTEATGPIPVTYDNAGNEIATGTLSTSTISARNYVATINTPAIDYTFRYNGQGVRTWTSETPKPPTGTTTKRYHFYTPDLRFLSRADYSVNASGTATLIRRIEPIWLAGIPVAQIDHNDLAFLRYTFTDHLGAPILQTSTTGAVIWQVDREPYGRVWRIRSGTLAAQPLQLPGQEVATERELYNIFRWYRAGWGRYTQADPLLASQSLMWSAGKPYAYVDGNPLRFTDPWGLFTWDESCGMCGRGNMNQAWREQLQNETDVACQMVDRLVTNRRRARCIKRSCERAVVECGDCPARTSPTGGAPAIGAAEATLGSMWRPRRRAKICTNSGMNSTQRAGAGAIVLIHEFAHGCGWPDLGGEGVPDPWARSYTDEAQRWGFQ